MMTMFIIIKHTTCALVLLMLLLLSVADAGNNNNNNSNLRRGLQEDDVVDEPVVVVGGCPNDSPLSTGLSNTCDGCIDGLQCNYNYIYFATTRTAGPHTICEEPLKCEPSEFCTWDATNSFWACATYGMVNCKSSPTPPADMGTTCTPTPPETTP